MFAQDCNDLKQKLFTEAEKGIVYFYFSSGSMIPRNKNQSIEEEKMLIKYPNIKIVNGGCAVDICDLEYEAIDYH